MIRSVADLELTVYSITCPVVIEGALNFEALRLHDDLEDQPVVEEPKHLAFDHIRPDARRIECPPLSQWECLSARQVPGELHLAPKPVAKIAVAHSSTLKLTRFQRFIRRMESAGPRIVLDRLKEEWQEPPEEAEDEEVCFIAEL
jgi:hypothetical protein